MPRIAMMGACFAALCLVTGCSDEPDFDARFDEANAEIQQRIDALDAEEARLRAELGIADEAKADATIERAGKHLNFHLPVPEGVPTETASSGE
jgi:outer membrane murein-binding lipoprotein Lpp